MPPKSSFFPCIGLRFSLHLVWWLHFQKAPARPSRGCHWLLERPQRNYENPPACTMWQPKEHPREFLDFVRLSIAGKSRCQHFVPASFHWPSPTRPRETRIVSTRRHTLSLPVRQMSSASLSSLSFTFDIGWEYMNKFDASHALNSGQYFRHTENTSAARRTGNAVGL